MDTYVLHRWSALALLGAVATTACSDSPTDPPEPQFELSGEVVGQGDFGDFSASADAEVFTGNTDVTFELENVPEEAEDGLSWTFREGSCEDPGDALGEADDYPAIEADEDGTWTGTALVVPPEEGVLVDIHVEDAEGNDDNGDNDDNGGPLPVACGELEGENDD